MTATLTKEPVARTESRPAPKGLITFVAILAFVVGFGAIAGGIFGAWYTYDQAVAQDITTPDDAVIAETPVRGPFTLWAQSDIITHHQRDRTAGLYYAQMPRQVEQLDEAGNVVLDEAGEPVMVSNEARMSWLNATTLTTSLGLGILAYAFSFFAIFVGVVFVAMGFLFWKLRSVKLATV